MYFVFQLDTDFTEWMDGIPQHNNSYYSQTLKSKSIFYVPVSLFANSSP
jgi:hypothetical protein